MEGTSLFAENYLSFHNGTGGNADCLVPDNISPKDLFQNRFYSIVGSSDEIKAVLTDFTVEYRNISSHFAEHETQMTS